MTEQVKENVIDLGEHFFHVGLASVARVTGSISEERLTLDVNVRPNCIPVEVIAERDEESQENMQAMRDEAADQMVEALKKFIVAEGGEVQEDDFTLISQELHRVSE